MLLIIFYIVLSNPEESDKLMPMLGSFHTAKVVEYCIGKYLRGSGVEDARVETGVFGLKAAESMMNGSHYIRSLRGIIILADALNTLKWEAFWKTNDLLTENALFDGDFTVKPAKPVMIEELEAHLDKEEDFIFEKESELPSGVFVDFMSIVRRAPLKKMHMLSEVLEFLWNSCTKACKVDQVDFIFDSYIENSIKEGERQRRSAVEAPLQFVRLEETTQYQFKLRDFDPAQKIRRYFRYYSVTTE